MPENKNYYYDVALKVNDSQIASADRAVPQAPTPGAKRRYTLHGVLWQRPDRQSYVNKPCRMTCKQDGKGGGTNAYTFDLKFTGIENGTAGKAYLEAV